MYIFTSVLNWALVQVSNMECMVFYLKGVNFYELRRPPWISQTLFAYWYKEDLKTTKSKTFILTMTCVEKVTEIPMKFWGNLKSFSPRVSQNKSLLRIVSRDDFHSLKSKSSIYCLLPVVLRKCCETNLVRWWKGV